ncbi:hypothetical protein ABW19_dt0205721 [Dactylella cylindrospora]|nr:hypothetical protein ABW19_dt0205721 [Dactylella cylindrospora]
MCVLTSRQVRFPACSMTKYSTPPPTHSLHHPSIGRQFHISHPHDAASRILKRHLWDAKIRIEYRSDSQESKRRGEEGFLCVTSFVWDPSSLHRRAPTNMQQQIVFLVCLKPKKSLSSEATVGTSSMCSDARCRLNRTIRA